MFVPGLTVSNAAVPPESDTLSPSIAPLRLRVNTVATVVPSHTLSAAVKLPVTLFAVMLAVVLAVVLTRL